METQHSTDTEREELAMVRTRIPESTKARLEHILHLQGMTIYEYMQYCIMLPLAYAKADEQWFRTADQFKTPFQQHLYSLLSQAHSNKAWLRTIRGLEGMEDVLSYDFAKRIESIVVTFKDAGTATMQNPGIFEEMTYSANDALESIITHIEPLNGLLMQIRQRVGEDKQIADILHLALSDHLEDIMHAGSEGYAMNEYGNVPVRHNNRDRYGK